MTRYGVTHAVLTTLQIIFALGMCALAIILVFAIGRWEIVFAPISMWVVGFLVMWEWQRQIRRDADIHRRVASLEERRQ